MSEKKIHLKIITHEKIVYENDIDELYCMGMDGSFGILPDHTPFMSALAIGVTQTVVNGKNDYFAIIGGVLQFTNNQAVILSEEAENGKDIDITVAKAEKERLEARIGSPEAQKNIQAENKALAMALAKFKAAMNESN